MAVDVHQMKGDAVGSLSFCFCAAVAAMATVVSADLETEMAAAAIPSSGFFCCAAVVATVSKPTTLYSV